MCRRSSGAGTSNHQTASSRRRNSGGISSGRLAVPTKKNGAAGVLQPGQQVAEHPGRRPTVRMGGALHPVDPFLHLVGVQDAGGDGFHDARHLAGAVLALAHEAAEQPAHVEPDDGQVPAHTDRLGDEALGRARDAGEQGCRTGSIP